LLLVRDNSSGVMSLRKAGLGGTAGGQSFSDCCSFGSERDGEFDCKIVDSDDTSGDGMEEVE
jgi:hypothetical protein